MAILKRSNSDDPDFRKLVAFLDQDLKKRDGDDHAFYEQFNKVDAIKHVVIAYAEHKPVGCGAIKIYDSHTWELKRMFVPSENRGIGIATSVLVELERWARELNCKKLILETGLAQPEAIALYKRNGYCSMPNYDQYEGVGNSVCMSKDL